MQLFQTGRWPSIWDGAQLKQLIADLIESGPDFETRFYQQGDLRGPFACQGDVVQLRSPRPEINGDGDIFLPLHEYEHWLVIGNTCDMDRVEVTHSSIVPLVRVDPAPSSDELQKLRRYEYFKHFYVPPWTNSPDHPHHLAAFIEPVTIAKAALRDDCAKVVARLEFAAWALLHTCLVRYLARDDGRFD